MTLASRRTVAVIVAALGGSGCTPAPQAVDRPAELRETVDDIVVRAPESAPPPSPGSVPAFVLHTAEQSMIVPIHPFDAIDGSTPTVVEGLWIQDDRGPEPVVRHVLVVSDARAERLRLPRCACLGASAACPEGTLEVRRLDAAGAMILAPGSKACRCIREPNGPGDPPPEGVDDRGLPFEPCEGTERESIASLVGGRLFYQGSSGNGGCYDGLNLYDAFSRAVALVDAPPPIERVGMRPVRCAIDLDVTERPWPLSPGDDGDCGGPDVEVESQVFVLRRGALWWVGSEESGSGSSRRWAKREVTPTDCPSVNDPCGDPEPYRGKAALGSGRREFWVATDGSAALVAQGHRYELWRRDEAEPLRFERPGIDATRDVIGVRVYADVEPLRAAATRHATLGREPTDGRDPDTSTPTDCAARSGLGIHPTDEPLVARGNARQWGARCIRHRRATRWTFAEAACLRGLAAATTDPERAALRYELGRIAEAQRAWAQALEHYRASLSLRPGDRTVVEAEARVLGRVEARRRASSEGTRERSHD